MSADEARERIDDESAAISARGKRIEALILLAVAVGVLVVARMLQPSPQGFGTHEQIFVIPCAFRWLTGLPCPMCGMTTAFALMARGEVLAALEAHVLGPALYLATWVVAASAVVGLVRGRPALPRWVSGPGGARTMLLLIGAGWLANLAMHIFGG